MAEDKTASEVTSEFAPGEAPVAIKPARKPRAPKSVTTESPVKEEVKAKASRSRKPKLETAPPAPEEVPVETPAPVIEDTVERDDTGGALTIEGLFGSHAYYEGESEEARTFRELAAGRVADNVYDNANDEAAYSQNGVVLAPGYWQAWAGKGGRINVFAWLGFIAAFVFFPFGLLFGGIGFLNSKAVPDDRFSRYLSAFALGLSVFFTFLILIPLFFRVAYAVASLSWGTYGG